MLHQAIINKRYVIFGGTGSLGTALTRRLVRLGCEVCVFSRDEAKHFRHKAEFFRDQKYITYHLGDVRNYASVLECLRAFNPDVVISAAAMKQVPLCEQFPYEAVQTNIVGAENIARACKEYMQGKSHVLKILSVSTDKAVKSVNAYGATKALQEKIHLSNHSQDQRLIFNVVRYGNVLESTGSVIPVFNSLIRAKRKLTITDARMTRFLLSLDEAVDLIFHAIVRHDGGCILVPHVRSAFVVDIAAVMLHAHQCTKVLEDYENNVDYVGIRPGEKLDELLVSEEECSRVSDCHNYFAVYPKGLWTGWTEHNFCSGKTDNLLGIRELYKYLVEANVLPCMSIPRSESPAQAAS